MFAVYSNTFVFTTIPYTLHSPALFIKSPKAKQIKRTRLSALDGTVSGTYLPGVSPWKLPDLRADFAFPCATQNEIDEEGASLLTKNGAMGVFEGANLPVTPGGQEVLRSHHPRVVYVPGKAANAGGVGVSGLEMSQNASRQVFPANPHFFFMSSFGIVFFFAYSNNRCRVIRGV